MQNTHRNKCPVNTPTINESAVFMFIISLTYSKPVEEVDRLLAAHYEYIKTFMDRKKFLVVGPKVPRTGGIILCNAASRAEVEDIVRQDPFTLHEIGTFEIIEFTPTKYTEMFNGLLG